MPGNWGTRGPVSLRIAEVVNQVTAKNITADLQGSYPWSEENPLLLSDVSVDVLGGKIIMKQLRMPQHDPALLRVAKCLFQRTDQRGESQTICDVRPG
ncbi:Dicarboxylate transport [Citrobacter koseri]|uniref:Dicarboxylate transport n=1 Tax=Citrobacter koseri TaxID=545 RepID=A0A2X2WNT5_CITKO|nr:Dicarboxylate transport [Citrobacter koseri]